MSATHEPGAPPPTIDPAPVESDRNETTLPSPEVPLAERMTSAPAPTERVGHVVLLWDTPNMDMSLANVLGGVKGSRETRPDFTAIGGWLWERALAEGPGVLARAIAFVNVMPGTHPTSPPARFVHRLREIGFETFVRPKRTADHDIDDAIVETVREAAAGAACRFILASHDAPLFERVAAAAGPAPVAVLGFCEMMPPRLQEQCREFIDVAQVRGLFPTDLPRSVGLDYDDLPDEGRLLLPLGSLRREYTARSKRPVLRDPSPAPLTTADPAPAPPASKATTLGEARRVFDEVLAEISEELAAGLPLASLMHRLTERIDFAALGHDKPGAALPTLLDGAGVELVADPRHGRVLRRRRG